MGLVLLVVHRVTAAEMHLYPRAVRVEEFGSAGRNSYQFDVVFRFPEDSR